MKPLLAVGMLLLSGPALADRYVTCDPYPPGTAHPREFMVSVDGAAEVSSPAESGGKCGPGRRLCYKLVDLGFGEHVVSVRAKSGDTLSGVSKFTFSQGIADPSGLKVIVIVPAASIKK